MVTKKKYLPINPEFSKDKKTVYLDASVFESILEETQELREKIKQFNKKQNTKDRNTK